MVTEQSTKPSTTNQRPSSMLCGAAWQDQYIAEASVVTLMMQMDAEFTKRTLRAPCGSRVRRSLICIFLIDVELAQGDGKNITGNITEVRRSRSANPLNIGSPTRARTWDLRINRLGRSWDRISNQALATHAMFQEQQHTALNERHEGETSYEIATLLIV